MTTNVLDFLEKTTARSPHKTAVIEESNSVTYSELTSISKKIGSSLSSVVQPCTPVAVYCEKGIDALCAFFGILYAGGFYSLFNTDLPDIRLKNMQSVLGAGVIITTDALKQKAGMLFPGVLIFTVSELKKDDADNKKLALIRGKAVDTDPVYVNFTSGSTGIPKGIAVAHRSIIDFINVFTGLFRISNNDVIANQAPFDFDVSVKDIYSAIKKGATLVIVPKNLFSNPVKLVDCLCENRVTTLIWAVSALCLLSTFHGLDYKTPETVNKILFSGEVLPYKHLLEWQRHLPDALYVNLYGPTEITCNCTYHILRKNCDYSAGIPIGIHFPNEDVFLLDEKGRKITSIDKIGKITVRGSCLALGYYNMPEKTSEAFIPNPLNTCYPETVYSTGDLGKFSANGELLFCGRADNQIKYMGHRIELEEIERLISETDGVERCFCMFDSEKSKLKAYYVGSTETDILLTSLRNKMPTYMMPGQIRRLESFPLTKNGKIDRRKAAEMVGG